MAAKGGIDQIFDQEGLNKDLAAAMAKIEKFYEELGKMAKEGAIAGGNVKGSGNISEQKANQQALNKVNDEAAKQLKELAAAEAALQKAQSAHGAELAAVKEKTRLQNEVNRDAAKLNGLAKDSIKAIDVEIKKLTQSYSALSKAERDSAKGKEMQQSIKEKADAMRNLKTAMGDWKANVGNYTSALSGFGGAAGKIGDVIGDVTQKLSASPWVVAISLLVSAVGGMVASLKSADSASDELDATMSGMRATTEILTDRLANLTIGIGKYVSGNFAEGIGQITQSFIGLGDAMTNAAIAGDKYARQMDEIDERNIQFISKEAQLRNEAAKLIEVYQDNTKGIGERKDALSKSLEYENQIYEFKKKQAESSYRAELTRAEGVTGISSKVLDWVIKNDREVVLSKAKTDARVQKAWEKLYGKDGTLAKLLQEKNAAILNSDSDEFEGKKKAIAKLTNFQKEENAKAAAEALKEKTAAFATEKKEINDIILEYLRLTRAIRGTGGKLRQGPGTAQVNTGVPAAPGTMEKIDNPVPVTSEGAMDNTLNENVSMEAAAWNSKVQIAQDALAKIDNLVNMSYQNRFAKIDEESKADEAERNRQLNQAQGNTSKQIEINAKFDAKEKEREKEKRRLQKEQAKYQKTSAITNAIINTALAVTAQLSLPVVGWVMAALALAAGIAEIAVISSQPLPSYRQGTKGTSRDEVAKVHAGELIRYPSGELVPTGDAAETLAFLPKGTQVIPHEELVQIAGRSASYMPDYRRTGETVNDYSGLRSDIRKLNRDIINKPETTFAFENGELRRFVKSGNVQEEWINNRVKL